MPVQESTILNALSLLLDPNTGVDYVTGKCIRNLKIEGSVVSLEVVLGYPAQSQISMIQEQIKSTVLAAGASNCQVIVRSNIIAHTVQRGLSLVKGVKNVIAVASGKGGVGKSTTAANLALALAAEGARVGILDADIYGPSQPLLLGLQGQTPQSEDGKTMLPLSAHGVQAMSIGFLVDSDQAMVWRGPMVSQALQQLLNETQWDDLDYLVIDLPPGTGDIQLTLAQKVPVTGAVIVTTPQDLALLDARKGIKMFEKVAVPIVGVIENMSQHICSQCGHMEPIFGHGGGAAMAADFNVTLLGQLPLDMRIRLQADAGSPTVVADPDGELAKIYKKIARQVAIKIAQQAESHSAKFPKIVITPQK